MSAQVVEQPTSTQFDVAVATLKLLADRTRLQIVWSLLHGEHSVSGVAGHVGVSAATASQHLAKLRLAGLVRSRRDGNWIFYAAQNDHILRLVTEALFHASGGGPEALAIQTGVSAS
jgi:DNA-binding transcriptional ArsR family regulator